MSGTFEEVGGLGIKRNWSIGCSRNMRTSGRELGERNPGGHGIQAEDHYLLKQEVRQPMATSGCLCSLSLAAQLIALFFN